MANKSFEVSLILSAHDKASRVVMEATAKAEKAMKRFSQMGDKAFKIGRQAGVAGTVFAGILAAPLKAAADMESMNVSLQTSFQGNAEAASKAFDDINKFAAKTPFALEEVTSGFIKLKNMGLDPSEEALTAYGNTASAMGKSLNDMVEAVADAATGEFERLKEFGIKAKSEGDNVTFTFQGVATTVGKNSAEIEQYLKFIGNTKFAGGIEAQSKTVNGMLSTLRDGAIMTAAKIGTTLIPAVKSLMDRITPVINAISKWVDRNPRLTKTILAITAAMAALSFAVSVGAFLFGGISKAISAAIAVKEAYLFMTNLTAMAEKGSVTAKVILKVATWAATAAQWAWNAAMYANPLVWVVLGVMALIAVVVLLVKNWDKVTAFFVSLWDKIKKLFAQAWDFIKKYGLYMIGPIGWMIKGYSLLISFFISLWPKIKAIFMSFINWLAQLPQWFYEMGGNIIDGIWQGIKSKATALFDYVKEIGSKIKNAFKGVLGINSPSKVFMEYGVNITEGAKLGMQKGAPGVTGASSGLASSISPVAGARGGGIGGIGGGVTVNFSPVINSGGNGQDISQQLRGMIPMLVRELQAEMARKQRLSY